MSHEISWVNVSPSLLTKDQTLFSSPPLFLCLSFSACLCWPLYLTPVSVCAHRDEGGTTAQSHLGRERAECHQEPPLSYTWGAPAMEGGYAALHANCSPGAIRLPPYTGAQKHWRLINMKGVWTLLCKHVLKTVIFFRSIVSITCALALWEHGDDIPWHFMRSMCHKADIKVDIQLTWRWIGCHKHWWHYITNDAKFSWHCRDIEQCRLCNRIRSSFSKRWPKS